MRHWDTGRWLTIGAALWLAAAPGLSAGEEKPAPKKAEGGAHNQDSNSPYFVLDALPVSIIRDSVGKGILVVEIGLDAKTLPARPGVEHLVPRLRDLYIRVLNLYVSRDFHLNQPADAALIKARLQMATDEVLGPGKASVLLRQILERRTK